jgi:putative PIN family toxin of toxin-antitoxin system
VRVFFDTNVLASAFGTRGLCSDILDIALEEHELITGEIVIKELRAVLSKKFHLAREKIDETENLLRSYHVEPEPKTLPKVRLRERSDLIVIASAIAAHANILVTGDKELLALPAKRAPLRIVSPREFWNLVAKD